MKKKRIFTKQRTKKIYYFFCIVLILIIIIIIIILYPKNRYGIFILNENINNFYTIPKNKKGKIISNSEIKILDYKNTLIHNLDNNNENFNFSIQIYSSSNYENALKKRNHFANNLAFNASDLLLVAINHNLGIDYLLVYKNFMTRNEALNYCSKYLNFIENCLIINFQNLN